MPGISPTRGLGAASFDGALSLPAAGGGGGMLGISPGPLRGGVWGAPVDPPGGGGAGIFPAVSLSALCDRPQSA